MVVLKKCSICNFKYFKLSFQRKKNTDKLKIVDNNIDKLSLKLILADKNISIVDFHKCKRCNQRTLVIKNIEKNQIEEVWLEYLSNLNLIDKQLNDTCQKINELKEIDGFKNDAIVKKIQILKQNFEVFKIQKDNLKHNMKASLSIKLHSPV